MDGSFVEERSVAVQNVAVKQVCVLGMGYIGLPTAAVLASRGHSVRGVDVNPQVVQVINSGKAHVVEPDLDILVRATVQTGNLRAVAEPTEADVFIICVPTPITEDHKPDLSFVFSAAASICPFVREGNLIILESTSPPGTTERIASLVRQKTGLHAPEQLFFAHAPERVLPGKILREVVENDRVIGGVNEPSSELCGAFYRTFVSGDIHLTSARTAEAVKLVENSFRDVNIAFANELSMIADELKLDVWELISLANRHPRVKILSPGCGVGGHCIAVDPWFLADAAPQVTPLIRAARQVNDHKPAWVVQRVARLAARFKDPVVACLGLAYKPDIDDLRESPAVEIVHGLQAAGAARLLVVEPNLPSHPQFQLHALESALAASDIVLVLVGHRQFKRIPDSQLAEKLIVDTCGILKRASRD
jgi:UDP-N-acetyl-D-mannosaminuronic acid dehydrogenase